MGDWVLRLRAQEVKLLKRYHFCRGIAQALNFLFTVGASAGTLLYLLYRTDGPGAINLVAVVALFKLLRVQLNMIPLSFNAFADGLVSLQRFDSLLNSDCAEIQLLMSVEMNQGSLDISYKNRSYHVRRGHIVGVEGANGSGRSHFLKQLLLAMSPKSIVGYCGQNAWLQNQSISDNVLFGEVYEPERYSRVIRSCQLETDLGLTPSGDQLVVGRNGVNLSGGQRQRISLARMIYSRASIWIIDDIFSSLDSDTTKRILEDAIACKPDDVTVFMLGCNDYCHMAIHLTSHSTSLASSKASVSAPEQFDAFKTSIKKESLPETSRSGHISCKLIKTWIGMNGGVPFIAACFALLALINQCRIGSEILVAGHGNQRPESAVLAGFLTYSAGQIVCPFLMTSLFYLSGLQASSRLHSFTLRNVLSAPLLKHTSVPISKVINRFSRDQESLDNGLIVSSAAFAVMSGVLCFTASAIISRNWLIMTIPVLAVFALYFCFAVVYRASMREAKRLESVSRTPICNRVMELAEGHAIIRGLHQARNFSNHMAELIAANCALRLFLVTGQVWFTLRIEVIGAFLTTLVGLGAAWSRMNPAIAGLVLSYSSSLSGLAMWTIRQLSHAETNLIAFERISDLADEFSPEADSISLVKPMEDGKAPEIELRGVCASFDGVPYLRGIFMKLEAGKRSCIVGRTGSGKSSLLLTILKVYPLDSGTLHIGGVDLGDMMASEVRNLIDYAPQEPNMFIGMSVRFNVDPKGTHSDDAIWSILKYLHMPLESLDELIDNDTSTSVCELVAVARALARNNRVLLMDEPMASLTGSALQIILSDPGFISKLSGKTVVIVTHRQELINFCQGGQFTLSYGQLCR